MRSAVSLTYQHLIAGHHISATTLWRTLDVLAMHATEHASVRPDHEHDAEGWSVLLDEDERARRADR